MESKPFALIRPPTTKGAFRVSPGSPERHRIENLGDTSSDFLRVELKHVSLGLLEPFRGKAPPGPLQSQDSIEFRDPSVQIERIICVDQSPCSIKPSPSPSLIVAFSAFNLTGLASGQTEKLGEGDVRWLPSSQQATVTLDAATPAHLLRIILPAVHKSSSLHSKTSN
jgi:hypothetical protein